MKKRRSPSPYHKLLRHTQKELTPSERHFSRLIHRRSTRSIVMLLEQVFFRSTPMIVASLTALVVCFFVLFIASTFNYHVVSLSFIGAVFVLGYTIGLVYEYVQSIRRRS